MAQTSTGAARTSRRTALAAAWSVPVITAAAAAPAVAASACTPLTISWATVAAGTTVSSASVGGVTMTIALSAVTGAASNNQQIYTQPLGGQSRSLSFFLDSRTTSSETITFSFSQPVTALSMTWLDVDKNGTSWSEQLQIVSSGWSTTFVGSAVTQTGSTFVGSANADNSGTTGNVGLSFAGPVQTVQFTYSQLINGSGSSGIGVGPITFTPTSC